MKKEINKQINRDSINWVEVIEGLEGKTTFTSHDIKRALRSTGRTFNANGVFYSVVKDFIKALGNTVTQSMIMGEVVYNITSTKDAIQAVDHKKPKKKTGSADLSANLMESLKDTKTITEVDPIDDVDKIKEFFSTKRSTKSLDCSIYFLAIFLKHSETKLSSKVIESEFTSFGVNYKSFLTYLKAEVKEIYGLLGFNPIVSHKKGWESLWSISGNKDLLDEYSHLCEIYEKVTGGKFRNLDEYIMSSKKELKETKEVATPEKKEEATIKPEKPQTEKIISSRDIFSSPLCNKKVKREIRKEMDPEVIWKKWLLVSASKNFLGGNMSVTSLVSWIKTNRHYEIDEEEARKLYRELSVDTESGLNYSPADYVTLTAEAWKRLSEFYSPSKFKETILIKLPLPLETVSNAFTGLRFELDDTTNSGMYLYTIDINRSMEHEIALKKLIKFIKIAGKLYTENSWMVNRVMSIISKEESEEKSKNTSLLLLENKL